MEERRYYMLRFYKKKSSSKSLCFVITFQILLVTGVYINVYKLPHEISDELLNAMATNNVKTSIMIRFAPENIVLAFINREEFINRHVHHWLIFVEQFIKTTFYIHKSSNFLIFRLSYSLQVEIY